MSEEEPLKNDESEKGKNVPDECVVGVPCKFVNSKPDSNYYIAYKDGSGNWQEFEMHCDEGCYPNPQSKILETADVGDCAYFECQCDGSGAQNGQPVAP